MVKILAFYLLLLFCFSVCTAKRIRASVKMRAAKRSPHPARSSSTNHFSPRFWEKYEFEAELKDGENVTLVPRILPPRLSGIDENGFPKSPELVETKLSLSASALRKFVDDMEQQRDRIRESQLNSCTPVEAPDLPSLYHFAPAELRNGLDMVGYPVGTVYKGSIVSTHVCFSWPGTNRHLTPLILNNIFTWKDTGGATLWVVNNHVARRVSTVARFKFNDFYYLPSAVHRTETDLGDGTDDISAALRQDQEISPEQWRKNIAHYPEMTRLQHFDHKIGPLRLDPYLNLGETMYVPDAAQTIEVEEVYDELNHMASLRRCFHVRFEVQEDWPEGNYALSFDNIPFVHNGKLTQTTLFGPNFFEVVDERFARVKVLKPDDDAVNVDPFEPAPRSADFDVRLYPAPNRHFDKKSAIKRLADDDDVALFEDFE